MSNAFQIVVCGGIAPDPLQRLEPLFSSVCPTLKNEMMLPAVLDPWASNALYEAGRLAKNNEGSKVYLLTIGPKAKIQQVMMVIGQKLSFELIAVDAPAGGFTESYEIASLLFNAVKLIQGLDMNRLLLFGGWESATRASGSTLQYLGEMLGIKNQFQGVDEIRILDSNSFEVLERVEGGKHQVSKCKALPAVFGWATGNLAEPPNNPQIGMQNMRAIMPALQKAKMEKLANEGVSFLQTNMPLEQRQTQIVKDVSADVIAQEIVSWIKIG